MVGPGSRAATRGPRGGGERAVDAGSPGFGKADVGLDGLGLSLWERVLAETGVCEAGMDAGGAGRQY